MSIMNLLYTTKLLIFNGKFKQIFKEIMNRILAYKF